MRKFSGFFYLFEEPRKKLKNVPLAVSLRALFYVVKSFADYQNWQKIRFRAKNTSTKIDLRRQLTVLHELYIGDYSIDFPEAS